MHAQTIAMGLAPGQAPKQMSCKATLFFENMFSQIPQRPHPGAAHIRYGSPQFRGPAPASACSDRPAALRNGGFATRSARRPSRPRPTEMAIRSGCSGPTCRAPSTSKLRPVFSTVFRVRSGSRALRKARRLRERRRVAVGRRLGCGGRYTPLPQFGRVDARSGRLRRLRARARSEPQRPQLYHHVHDRYRRHRVAVGSCDWMGARSV